MLRSSPHNHHQHHHHQHHHGKDKQQWFVYGRDQLLLIITIAVQNVVVAMWVNDAEMKPPTSPNFIYTVRVYDVLVWVNSSDFLSSFPFARSKTFTWSRHRQSNNLSVAPFTTLCTFSLRTHLYIFVRPPIIHITLYYDYYIDILR